MRRWAYLALVLLTIACRLAYVVPLRLDMAAHPIRSAEVELAAISLLEKGELGNVYHDPTGPTAHVSPLYPLVVAAIYAVFGVNTLAAMLVQSLLASATIAATLGCLPWLARRSGLHEAAGWIAAFTLAVLPINYFYESFGDWEQPLAGLVLIGLLACFLELRACGWQRPRLVAALGLLSGVAALLSPSLLPALALMLLVAICQGAAHEVSGQVPSRLPRARLFPVLAGSACVVLITALFVAPWMIRNYFALGGFVPLRSNFGMELSYGNHPGSTGSSNVDWSHPGISDKVRHPQPNAAECRKLAEMGELAYMRERQADAIAWIGENPGRFAELTVHRFRLFWFPGREMFHNASLSTTVKIAAFGVISALLFLGLFRLAWTRNGSFGLIAAAIFGTSFIYFITHVELRYRLPIHALSALLAADFAVVVVVWAWHFLRSPMAIGLRNP